MELVVDTNVVLSALLKRSTTHRIIFSGEVKLFAPDHCIKEVEKYSLEFAKRMEKSKQEVDSALALIFSQINVVESNQYYKFKTQAMNSLMDKKDWTFLALSLSMRLPIWSNDKGFKGQDLVKVYSTKELLEKIEENEKRENQ